MSVFNRRSVLKSTAALGGALLMPLKTLADAGTPLLRATPSTAQLAPRGYPQTDVWTYATDGAGTVPGPELRVKAGARITRRLVNELPQSTAVHWHGIRIDNAMDGAAPLTQAPVPPGASFEYDFVAPDPGTYWYHSHDRGWEQVSRGLAGPLIVEDTTPWLGEPGAATREITLVLDDWLLDAEAAIVEGRWRDLRAASHAGRMGNTVTVNGMAFPDFPLKPNERVRLRLINTATDRIMRLAMPDLIAHLIALDGHPVAPRQVDTLTLAPAQRADVVVDAQGGANPSAPLLLDPGSGEWIDIATFSIDGARLDVADADVRPLPAWGSLPARDMRNAQRETLRMDGGAMRWLSEAEHGGQSLDGRTLASQGMVWAFNGVAHGMQKPMFEAKIGRTVIVNIENRTAFSHAIHLHGHHFAVLTRNGQRDPYQDMHDTVLIAAGQSAEIAFVADNPGRWMIHCHMLSHQASGMMSWFNVT